MEELTRDQAHQVWHAAETLKRVSDRIISIGPFGIGLDGVTALVPVVGTIFSVAAGGWILWQGVKARASAFTLARMAVYVAADSGVGSVPLVGQAADFFFQGHLLAANALQKDIVKRFGAPDPVMRSAGRSSTARTATSA